MYSKWILKTIVLSFRAFVWYHVKCGIIGVAVRVVGNVYNDEVGPTRSINVGIAYENSSGSVVWKKCIRVGLHFG